MRRMDMSASPAMQAADLAVKQGRVMSCVNRRFIVQCSKQDPGKLSGRNWQVVQQGLFNRITSIEVRYVPFTALTCLSPPILPLNPKP